MSLNNVIAGNKVWNTAQKCVEEVTRTTKTQILIGNRRYSRRTGLRIAPGSWKSSIEALGDQEAQWAAVLAAKEKVQQSRQAEQRLTAAMSRRTYDFQAHDELIQVLDAATAAINAFYDEYGQ